MGSMRLLFCWAMVTIGCGNNGGNLDGAADAAVDHRRMSDYVVAPDSCVQPGAAGNSHGVGKYCTPHGGECVDTPLAFFCTVDNRLSAPPFCTYPCSFDEDCGEDAICTGDGSGSAKGCFPIVCARPGQDFLRLARDLGLPDDSSVIDEDLDFDDLGATD